MADDNGGTIRLSDGSADYARPPAPDGSGVKSKPKIAALAPWYGSNRLGAGRVGLALAGCEWVGIAFAGGCCEIPEIAARTIVANDIHCDVVNLANVVGNEIAFGAMRSIVDKQVFHPHTLRESQEICKGFRRHYVKNGRPLLAPIWAAAYFAVAWMTRSGTAGTNGELTGKLCLRWEAGGGDSSIRYRNAVASLPAWHETLKRCTFSCLEYPEFLAKCKDRPRHGIYCDPPFPGAGEKYSNTFAESEHLFLATKLEEFSESRIVVRYYDHPMIRDLYRESDGWTWDHWTGRKQTNRDAPEVLIVRN